MGLKEVDLTGGDSVFCINTSQMKRAYEITGSDPVSGPKVSSYLEELESQLSRNERAALSFMIIDRLQKIDS